jgi:putative acetyltransferase
MVLRVYADRDLEAVVRCFGESVRAIGARSYTPQQIEAWAPDPPDLLAWAIRFRSGTILVADEDGVVAGFVRFEANGLVDLLYVHPDHERQGIGRALLEAACDRMLRHGTRRLVSEVSLAARPLFEASGFRVESEQSVERRGIRFLNFRMARELDGG